MFAKEHAGTTWALHALDVAVVSGKLSAADVAPAIQLNFADMRDDVVAVGSLTWTALGADLLDDALTIAERGVELTRKKSPRELAALAQVHLARHEREAAVEALQLAVDLQPGNRRVAAELDDARHTAGVSQDRLETWRVASTKWAQLFYGVD